ncbi:DNA-directed RNA polymerase I subunit RPA43 [Eptesicus fuscus]|uniref:DNA-directed RNA polymerase I subunit RPA43 n=1 Tax=Eptesicus fuscus TaxID=29078 RepID=UPI0024045206|nr:DNA-directed RNA polymerase I subunit RPA43 [Eptesicus fuscus]
MAAGCPEPPRAQAASEGPVAGPAGALPCLELPTYAAACALLSSRYSCLVAGPHRRHIALSPRYLHRKRTGIREQLDAELLRYSESLLGVPIAYDNIKVVGELGDIYDDQGHIHLNIEADFIIFCPEPGQKLMGTVNKVSSSHIGCLVHGCFNASIPKPEQMPAEQWQTLEINVGDELEFEVFRLDSDAAGVFCIRGKLNTTSSQTKCSAVSEEITETGTEEAVEKPPKKKKKKKKKEPDEVEGGTMELADLSDVTRREETDLQIDNNVNGLWEEKPKKKKKKKKKDSEPDEVEGGTTELADVPEVAMKEETDLQIDNTMNVNGLWEEEPKKRKKKKKKKDPEPYEVEGGSTELADFPDVTLRGETDLQIDNVNSGLWEEEPEKKQHQEEQSQDPVFLASDSSGYQSDHKKKKKKRKHSEEAELTPLLEHSPKKKRKR